MPLKRLLISEFLTTFAESTDVLGCKGKKYHIPTSLKIWKRLLIVSFLTAWNSRKIQCNVKDEATVDVQEMCFVSPMSLFRFERTGHVMIRLISSVWVYPLLSFVTRQCEKPQVVGRRRESDPTLSFCVIIVTGEGSTLYD